MRNAAWRGRPARRGIAVLGCGALALALACGDDSVAPVPPKSENRAPESWLAVQADSLAPQYYKVVLRWFGSDPDGRVAAYQLRWICEDGGGGPCPAPPAPATTAATVDTFTLQVPNGTARYRFEVTAVDEEGTADPTPAVQAFDFYNLPPQAGFEPGTLPSNTLPAVTFYVRSTEPDTTADPDDLDAGRDLDRYRAWLDGAEGAAKEVPVEAGAVTFGPDDFGGRYGSRTVWVEVVDDGGAVSAAVQHTWAVVGPPPDGILLVDDCRMGGFLETKSDQSYRTVLQADAPERTVVLDVESIPRLSQADLEATLSLFQHVVWYTDADTVSSGALELARGGLEALGARGGHLFLGSGLAFGTRGAFGDREAWFRGFFGIDSLFRGPNGSTNFAILLEDTVQAAVTPEVPTLRFLSFGLRAIMECFASHQDGGATERLYSYAESTFVRATADSLRPFVNPVPFDIGVAHTSPSGARGVYVSFPIGLPINDNIGENEGEIRALLRRAGILP